MRAWWIETSGRDLSAAAILKYRTSTSDVVLCISLEFLSSRFSKMARAIPSRPEVSIHQSLQLLSFSWVHDEFHGLESRWC